MRLFGGFEECNQIAESSKGPLSPPHASEWGTVDTGVKTEGLLLKSAFGEQLGVTGSDGGRDRGPGGWKLRTHRSCKSEQIETKRDKKCLVK